MNIGAPMRSALTRRLLWALVPAMLVTAACGNRAGDDVAATKGPVAGAPAGTDLGVGAGTETPVADAGGIVDPAATAGGVTSGGVSSSPSGGGGAAGTPKAGGPSAGPATRTGSGTAAPAAGAAKAKSPTGAAAPAPGIPTPGGGAAPSPSGGTKAPVTIGNIGTWSGVFGGIGIPMLHGVKAWVGEVNARGGLNGHPVRLVSTDDNGEPGRALSETRRLVEQEKAIALLGAFMPTTEHALISYLEEKQVPLISTCNCAPADDLSPMIFPVGPGGLGNAWQHSLPLLTGVDQDVRDNIGVLYCREAPICPDAAKNIKTFQQQANFKIVWEAQASLAAPDYTSEMLAARNAGVKAIFEIMDNHSVLRIERAAQRQGFEVLHNVQFSMYDGRFENIPELEGVFTSSPTPMWSLSAKMADFREALKKHVPGAMGSAWGAEAFVAGKLLEKIAGTFSATPGPADVLNGLWSLKNETLGGLLPGITYYKGDKNRNKNLCFVPIRIKGGKFTPRDGDPDKFICAPGWQPGQKG